MKKMRPGKSVIEKSNPIRNFYNLFSGVFLSCWIQVWGQNFRFSKIEDGGPIFKFRVLCFESGIWQIWRFRDAKNPREQIWKKIITTRVSYKKYCIPYNFSWQKLITKSAQRKILKKILKSSFYCTLYVKILALWFFEYINRKCFSTLKKTLMLTMGSFITIFYTFVTRFYIVASL